MARNQKRHTLRRSPKWEILKVTNALRSLAIPRTREQRGLSHEYRAKFAVRLPSLFTIPVSLAGMWILYSTFIVKHNADLPPAIDAERRTFVDRSAGGLSYYVDRAARGRPLVLIHSINAAASAYEMRPLFSHYRAQRLTYALELPGFGFSDRTNREYSPQLYKQAILALLETQIKENTSADVVALSLGCEFAAAAAKERPDLVNSLTLISPSGLTARERKQASQRALQSNLSDIAYRVFSFPLWAQAFYDLLGSRPSISFFLRQSFEGPVPQDLIEYDDKTAHRPGARFAPLYFVSGKLFRPDIREEVYEQLPVPVLVLYDYDQFVGFDELPSVLERNSNWQAVQVVPTRGLPHWEKLGDTTTALDAFWLGVQVHA
jgi:pimeloyl-ACP methyl ester carboxylesterase